MFNFFRKKKIDNDSNFEIKIAALLIHAAKIDQNYSENEKKIIIKALIELGVKGEKTSEFLNKAEILEKNSNQILDFTKEIKNSDEKIKEKVLETLWNIIYSDGISDMYESNFMRRLTGLLYIDNAIAGNIKEKIKNKFKK
tara:strand:- start:116 stop:538 length:423 start_codon:yes stop_codon:yes gene_type:complete